MSLTEQEQAFLKRGVNPKPHLLHFPHPPCPQNCDYKVKRFHLTCLTCPIRRQKQGNSPFTLYKHAMIVMESASGRGFLLPTHYRSYGLFIPTDERGQVNILKAGILKFWMTIAERIAEL
jgi:hypothetical protein